MREELMKFLLAYRSTPQATIGQTPAKLVFGRELKTKIPELKCDRSIADEETGKGNSVRNRMLILVEKQNR